MPTCACFPCCFDLCLAVLRLTVQILLSVFLHAAADGWFFGNAQLFGLQVSSTLSYFRSLHRFGLFWASVHTLLHARAAARGAGVTGLGRHHDLPASPHPRQGPPKICAIAALP